MAAGDTALGGRSGRRRAHRCGPGAKLSGGVVKLGLGMGSGCSNRRRSGRQANAFQVVPNRGELRERGDHLQVPATDGANRDLQLENSGQQLSPGHTLGPWCRGTRAAAGRISSLLELGPWYDLISSCRIGGQHAVIAHQVEAWGRHQRGELLDEFMGRQDQAGPSGPPPQDRSSGAEPAPHGGPR